MPFRRSSIWTVGGLLSLWLLFGLLFVPHVLESAYQGSGFSPLTRALQETSSVSIDFLLAQWHEIVVIGVAVILGLWALIHVLAQPRAADRIVGEATPADIGAIRMLVCSVLLISTLWEDLASTAALPRELVRPMGLLQVFYLLPIGFDDFAASSAALFLFEWFTAAILFLGVIGWKTRLVLPLGAVCYLILGGLLRQYAWLYHTGLIALYLLIVLAILPSHHGASLDRLVKLWRGEPVAPAKPSRQYGWMRYALWATLAVPYVMAGLSKLRNGGLTWWEASNFKFILYQSTLRPMEFDFSLSLLLQSAPDVVFELLALSAVLGELLFGLVLFSRVARWIMPILMLLMHAGILFLQNILFFDLILLQIIFFNLRPLRGIVADRLVRREDRLTILFDPRHPTQQRLVRILKACDLFDRLDAQADDATAAAGAGAGQSLSEYSGRFEAGVEHPGALTGAYRSRYYHGATLWCLIAARLPVLWAIAPAMYVLLYFEHIASRFSTRSLPSSSPALHPPDHDGSDFVPHDRIQPDAHPPDLARAALDHPATLSSTPAVRNHNPPSPTEMPRDGRLSVSRGGGPRLTFGITCLLVFLWLFRVEFYPFTGMQMFSKKRSEPVSYVIALAHLRSGDVVRAPIEKSIRSMSDSRYRRVMEMAFDPEREHVSAAFFDSVLQRWNRKVLSDAESIVGFELQRWEWYFDSDPDDPAFGRLIDTTIYPAESDGDIDFAPTRASSPMHNQLDGSTL